MKNLQKKWTVYCSHSSHTDIGYTDTQEEIEFQHIGFIHEVIDILNAAYTTKPEWRGFKWTCESFWCVRRFLETADASYIDDFVKYVKKGDIGISASYLNLTELVSAEVLDRMIQHSIQLLDRYGLKTDFAMTADINGYSWGFAESLYKNNINHLMCCLHTHHGYHPTGMNQNPFYWETPAGNRILVWNGEHYNLGNELGLAQSGDAFEYTIRDGLDQKGLPLFEKAEQRIFSYLASLEESAYPYDMVPVNVSGMMTDNSPPSVKVIEFINRFNEKHGDKVQLVMATPHEVFQKVEQLGDIPVYRGDWTDWWADGIGSTPHAVAHYKDAVQKYHTLLKLDPNDTIISKGTKDEIASNLIFYAEHTWGYSSSISEPWNPYVNYLDMRKSLYACNANQQASVALDKIAEHHGKTGLSLFKNYKFKMINPHDIPVKSIGCINMEALYGHSNFDIVDDATGQAVPYQLGRYSRGYVVNVLSDLKANEEKVYAIVDKEAVPQKCCTRTARTGLDSAEDLAKTYAADAAGGSAVSQFGFENRFFQVKIEEKKGITSVYDKEKGQELITKDALYPAFTPIYEVTPVLNDPCDERRRMGRNRKAVHTKRYVGEMSYVRVLEDGSVYTRIELGYDLQGLSECAVILTAFKDTPRIDIDFRFHKANVWEPENVYLALPFTSPGSDDTLWIDKTGAALRPRIDQLPGSCTDFYLTQNGAVIDKKDRSLLLAFKDNPLVMMGDIKAHPIQLMGEEGVANNDYLYLWLMNNFWETNFKASLGGFYQFRLSLALTDAKPIDRSFQELEAINEGILSFYMFD